MWDEKHVDPLGLEDGKKVLPNKKLAQDFAEKLYAGIVAKTKAATEAEKKPGEARAKKEEELAETLFMKDTGVLMRDLVRKVVRQETHMKSKANDLDGDEIEGEADASKAAEVVRAPRSPQKSARGERPG